MVNGEYCTADNSQLTIHKIDVKYGKYKSY